MLNSLKRFATKHTELLLILFCFIVRLTNLTLLPIFNDEAIYLDWGARETEAGGNLYYSLYDNKQPLLMWVLGASEKIFADPLFGGRIVSVILGCITLLGVFKLSKRLFNKHVAILSSILYIFIPIFVFYDRQALMESAILTVGVWSLYLFVSLIETEKKKYVYLLGVSLGLGFFIKSTALLFAATILITSVLIYIKTKNIKILKSIFIVFIVMLFIDILFLLSPEFWSSLGKNSTYTYSLRELLSHPIIILKNLLANSEITFLFLTPVVFITGILGILRAFKLKERTNKIAVFWLVFTLFLETIFVRIPSQRYLVAFLTPLIIFSSYFVLSVSKKRIITFALVSCTLVIPFIISIFLILKPAEYILLFSKITSYSETQYIKDFTSGFGIKEAFNYLTNASKKEKIFVTYATNSGNPESALIVYLNKHPEMQGAYLDSQLLGNITDGADCINLGKKTYFVSRDQQQAGLNKFFVKVTDFKNPYSDYSIGIYTLKENCEGKTIKLQPAEL